MQSDRARSSGSVPACFTEHNVWPVLSTPVTLILCDGCMNSDDFTLKPDVNFCDSENSDFLLEITATLNLMHPYRGFCVLHRSSDAIHSKPVPHRNAGIDDCCIQTACYRTLKRETRCNAIQSQIHSVHAYTPCSKICITTNATYEFGYYANVDTRM